MKFETLFREFENSTEMIHALLAGITQEQARIRPAPDSWSILEVVCHLYDEEREDFREHLDFILHRQNEEWHRIDPQGWVVARKYNEQDFAEMQAKFFEERAKSLEWLGSLSEKDWETTYTSQFGSMRAGDMLASWVAHDNLHLRQLVELRRARIEQITKPYEIEYAGEW
ncbi:MAG TPA: DinB family protein [Anaerolineales bacterium]|nr:DinB family protein [Anaerolineales bacterium]